MKTKAKELLGWIKIDDERFWVYVDIRGIPAAGEGHGAPFHRRIRLCAVEVFVLGPVKVATLRQAAALELKRGD